MASIKKKSSGGGGANWMDTYGDMVTLLLCFFVLLYSMSTIDQEKWMMIVQSFNKTAEVSTDDYPRGPEGSGADELGGGMPATTNENPIDELYEFLQTYAASLASGSDSSDADSPVTVTMGDGRIYIAFSNAVFFGGDSWNLLNEGKDILDGILPSLDQAAPFIDEIVVIGHTATALGTYDVHWDFQLSTMRAVEVQTYLLRNSMALDPMRVYPEGRGQWLPVAGNELETDRSQNRRVEMIISGADLEEHLNDSVQQYYDTIQHDQPEDSIPQYYTDAG